MLSSSVVVRSKNALLTRDFIYNALYSKYGYFNKSSEHVVANTVPCGGISFNKLVGKHAYMKELARLYDLSPHGWLTPTEIFAPWYSQGIANYILQQFMKSRSSNVTSPLVIYEVGGGNGTNAKHILEYIKSSSPTIYRKMEYRIIDVSESLSSVQRTNLKDHLCCYFTVGDAMNLRESLSIDERPCFVIGMEVLDNLPHDKVVEMKVGSLSDREKDAYLMNVDDLVKSSGTTPMETWVSSVDSCSGKPNSSKSLLYPEIPLSDRVEVEDLHSERNSSLSEFYSPLSDDLIKEAWSLQEEANQLQMYSPDRDIMSPYSTASKLLNVLSGGSIVKQLFNRNKGPNKPNCITKASFVPTGSLRLLQSINNVLPNARLILADFDILPKPNVKRSISESDVTVATYAKADKSPLVASKNPSTREICDHKTYLSARAGIADIYFPTDFYLLTHFVHSVCGARPSRVLSDDVSKRYQYGGDVDPKQSIVRVVSSSDFLRKYAPTSFTATRTGYNPMLEDYSNTCFLLS